MSAEDDAIVSTQQRHDEISPEALLRLSPAEYYARFLDAGIRPDGRELAHARGVSLALGAVRTAAGSASARVGQTLAIAGVTCEAKNVSAASAPDADEGELLIRFDAPAISGVRASRGPSAGPGAADGIETFLLANLARARVLAPGALRISPRTAAWSLTVHVYCLDHDGNMLDAALLAALAALSHTRLPAARYDESASRVLLGEDAGADALAAAATASLLKLTHTPVPLSFARVLGHTLVDPTIAEEGMCESRLTVCIDEGARLHALLKPGGAPLADADLRACVELARVRAPVLHRLLADAHALSRARELPSAVKL